MIWRGVIDKLWSRKEIVMISDKEIGFWWFLLECDKESNSLILRVNKEVLCKEVRVW